MQENTSFHKVIIAILSLGIIFSPIGQVLWAQQDSLYYKVHDKKNVLVFLASFQDRTNTSFIKRENFDKGLKEALTSYGNIKFSIAAIKGDSLITIDRTVNEFVYSEKDPVDNFLGWPMLLWDSVNVDNYVRLITTFTVKDSSTGEILWNKTLSLRITKSEMSPEEGLDLASKRLCQKFVRKCFSRPVK